MAFDRDRNQRRRRRSGTYEGTSLPTGPSAPASELPPLDLEAIRVRESILGDVVKGTTILVATVTGVYLLASGIHYFLPNDITKAMDGILLTPENFDQWLEFFRAKVNGIQISE